jgi:hypothetical protein
VSFADGFFIIRARSGMVTNGEVNGGFNGGCVEGWSPELTAERVIVQTKYPDQSHRYNVPVSN